MSQATRQPLGHESQPGEAEVWDGVKAILGTETITLGNHWSFNLRQDPKRFAFVLSRYKFAAKMAAPPGIKPGISPGPGIMPSRSVIELGCSEGIGTPILAEGASRYHGVDMDGPAIADAQRNWATDTRTFERDDFLGKTYGRFDGAVSLDVCEHIQPTSEDRYFDTVAANLTDAGIAVVGTPNATSDEYASPMSKAGHVNLFTGGRLTEAMRRVFRNVFLFGLNDEVVHTGFTPMCHYLMAVGMNPRKPKDA